SNEAASVSRTTGCMAESGEVAVAFGVGEGQELLKFLIGLEDVSGEVVDGLDGLGVPVCQQLSDRQARPCWRTCRTVCAGCAHRDLRRIESVAALQHRLAADHCLSAPSRSAAG